MCDAENSEEAEDDVVELAAEAWPAWRKRATQLVDRFVSPCLVRTGPGVSWRVGLDNVSDTTNLSVDNPGETVLMIEIYSMPIQLVGGKDDGDVAYSPVILEITQMLEKFKESQATDVRVQLRALPLNDMPPHVRIFTQIDGLYVCFAVCCGPPPEGLSQSACLNVATGELRPARMPE